MSDIEDAEFALMSPATHRVLPDGVVPAHCKVLERADFPYGNVLFVTQEDLDIMEGPVPFEIQQIMDQVNAR